MNREARRKEERENRNKEVRRLKQKKMLLKCEKEIKKLKFQINHVGFANFKIHSIKNTRIFLKAIQGILPYLITFAISFKLSSLTGATPFLVDKKNEPLRIMKEFDNLGNIRIEEQYDDFDEDYSILKYFGKWEKSEDGFYKRLVEEYELNELTEEEITKMFDEKEKTLSDILGSPISSKVEKKNKLTEEEISKDPYMQAILYDKNKEDFIVVEESLGSNIGLTILILSMIIAVEVFVWGIRKDCSKYSFSSSVSELNEKYQNIDVEEIKKVLKIKEDNYRRLTR